MLEYEALKRALNAEPEFASKSAAFSSIVTSASLDALLAPSHRAYPVIVFSPGLGMPRALYTTYYQNLASSGYVVAVVDHPGMGVTPLPGHVSGEYPPLGADTPPEFRNRPEEERDAFWKSEEIYLAADQRFVIDQLVQLNRNGPPWVRGRLDESCIIHIGHSRGFSSPLCAHDARVIACVNLEGSPQLSERRLGLPHSLLTLRSPGRRGLISVIHSCSRVPSYDVEIQTATHNSVSDLGVLGPFPGRSLAVRNLEIISAFTLDFLQHVVAGDQNGIFYSLTRKYPEAVVDYYDRTGQKLPIEATKP
jgi:hypothetical protein